MRTFPILLAFALALAALPVAAAYPDQDKVPRYFASDCFETYDKRFVHDYLGMFDGVFGNELEGAACEVYAKTSAHYVIATVPDTEGESLEMYAVHLFREWGIGDKDRLDGLLMLFVDDYLGSGGSALRIEVGYGLEGVINSLVTTEAWDAMVDTRDRALAAGESEADARAYAMAAGSSVLLNKLVASYTDAGFPSPEPHDDAPPLIFWVIVILVVIILIILLSASSRGRRGWGYHPTSPSWSSRSSHIFVGGGGLGGGGGFGGGGSFGGGRSGGGGRGGRF